MSTFEPALVQYRVLTDRRLHFGRMYWVNIAFLLSLILVAIATAPPLSTTELALARGFAGVATLGMAVIAWRISRIESQLETALGHIEEGLISSGMPLVLRAPKSGAFGARMMVNTGLAILGAGFLVLAVSG